MRDTSTEQTFESLSFVHTSSKGIGGINQRNTQLIKQRKNTLYEWLETWIGWTAGPDQVAKSSNKNYNWFVPNMQPTDWIQAIYQFGMIISAHYSLGPIQSVHDKP